MGKFLAMAVARGYIGGAIRMPGDKFEVDAAAFSEHWMERIGGAAQAASPAPPVSQPGVIIPIPADWRAMHYTKRIALAKLISGMDVTADVAVTIIEAEAEARDALARVGKVPTAPVVKAPLTDAEIEAEANKLAEANDARDAAAAADEAAARAADEAADKDE